MPDAPPRLFLSYGVRDASDIAQRLHRDLTARGYKICQDVDRIRTGWAWDNELQDGLQSSQVVLALLSPHAVRRALDTGNVSQVDSVCLDEIAYARFKCKIPIVPVKVRPCEAPFLIYRLRSALCESRCGVPPDTRCAGNCNCCTGAFTAGGDRWCDWSGRGL
jgi:hypothetical protein